MPDARSEIILPAGAVADERRARLDSEGHAVVINETGLPDQLIEGATATFFEEHASVGGIGRAPSTFGVYSANQGSLLARTEYQTPTNVFEEIKLARELAERDDDIGAVMQSMIALAYGEGMENFHEEERTRSIFNSIAREMNLDRVLRELYREYLIAYQVNTVSLFTRGTVEYSLTASTRLRSDVLAWPLVGVLPAEQIRVLDNDMFGTGQLAYVPDNDRLREWLDEFFNPQTSAARKHEMAINDRVSAAMFTGVVEVDLASNADPDLQNTNGRLYTLNPRIVHRHTGPKGAWKYPRPLLTRNFALLEAKRLLNLMDFALLQGGANFIVVAKKGSDQRPATPPELENLKNVVRRASRTGVIIGDHRLTFDVITPKLDELLNPEKRRLIGRKLARGLMRLPELDDESGNEGVRLDAEFIARIIGNDRHELKRHVERTSYAEIAKRNPRRLARGAAKLWHPRIILQGSQYFTDLVLKLRDRGDIPRAWAVEAAGFDWEAGVQARQQELAEGVDETMQPGSVPHSSPENGPQDNNNGRPRGGADDRPRRQIGRNQGETITARFSEEFDRAYRMGDVTYAILAEHDEYSVGRVSEIDREMVDAEGAQHRGSSMYVPVNPEYECASYTAINLRDGLRMIIGETIGDRAQVAKLLVFREPEFKDIDAEEAAARWGFPVTRPDEPAETAEVISGPQLVEAVAAAVQNIPAPNITVEMQGGRVKRIITRDPESGEITGSEEVPVEE